MMTKQMFPKIGKATALVRAGRLAEATAAIQAELSGQSAMAQPDPMPSRTTLRETLRRIAAGGMPAATKVALQPDLPADARFLSLSHDGPHGSRVYRLYVPANSTALMPLIVMLHGCTQTPEDFAVGTGMNALAEEFACLVAYPAQPSGANAQKCWNWFRPEDQSAAAGEPALLADLVGDVIRDFPVDRDRIYVAGLSAGGAAAMIMGAAYPELFAAVGVHSGLPVGAASDVPSAFAAMRSGARGRPVATTPPTIVFHGLSDSTVNSANGRAVIAQAVKAGHATTTETRTVRGGRTAQITRHGAGAVLWEVEGAGHAWFGGNAAGSYADPSGPDASREMLQFFLAQSKTPGA